MAFNDIEGGGRAGDKLAPADSLWTTARDGTVRLRMDELGPGAEPPITTLQMFQRTVQRFGNHPAMAQKIDGQWEITTYLQYYQQCRAAAKSFLKLGLDRFHSVAILGFNSPEWLIADIGAIMAGGFAVGIYTTNSPAACQYVAENCKANVLVVENHQQLLKILQIQDQLPHLKAIVQYHDELQESRPNLYTWNDFMELGTDIPDSQLDDIIASQKVNQCFTLIYTSGTTGAAKGVMLSHDNITWSVNIMGRQLGAVNNEVIVSYLPLNHIAGQVLDIWMPICFGATVYFAKPDAMKGSLMATLQEVRPTLFLGVPRVWEKMHEKMKDTGVNSTFDQSSSSKPEGCTLDDNRVIQRIRAALGLDRCSWCLTAAAPISRETMEFFMSLNIPLLEAYGLSESTGPHTMSFSNGFRMSSCGLVLPGRKTRFYQPKEDGTGEICIWGRNVFMGYLDMEEMTKEALDEEGWLHTGDLGRFDEDDFLYVTGRIKELVITAGGENIAPVPIEKAVKEELTIISNAMLVGDRRKFLSMLLTLKCNIDTDTGEPLDDLTPEAVQFCQQLGSSATRVSELVTSKDKAVYDAIQKGMERANQKAISNAQKVQKWTILVKDFSIAGGELGPTLKLNRYVVLKKYEKLIDEFYTA